MLIPQKLSQTEIRTMKYLARNGQTDCGTLFYVSKSYGNMKRFFKKLEAKGYIFLRGFKGEGEHLKWADATITERGKERIIIDGPETEFAKAMREKEADRLYRESRVFPFSGVINSSHGWYKKFWEKYTDKSNFQEEGAIFYHAKKVRKIAEFLQNQ